MSARLARMRALPRAHPEISLGCIALAAWYALFGTGTVTGGDGRTMYEVSEALFPGLSVSVDADFGVRCADGTSCSPFAPGLTLLTLLPHVPLRALGAPEEVRLFAVSWILPLVTIGIALATYRLALTLGGGRRASALAALGATAGTVLLSYGKEFFAEPVGALFVVLGFDALLRRRWGWAGGFLAAAALARPQLWVAVIAGAIVCAAAARAAGPVLRFGAAAAPAVVIQIGYNIARFHTPTDFGYSQQRGFDHPFVDGLWEVVSGGRTSPLIFAPLLLLAPIGVLAFWRRDRAVTLALVATAIPVVWSAATWFDPSGGYSWGPRHLLVLIPVLLAGTAAWLTTPRRVAIFVALGLIGFAGAAPHAIAPSREQQLRPEIAPTVVNSYTAVPRVLSYSIDHLSDRRGAADDHRRWVATWQFHLARRYGAAGLLAGMIVTGLIVTMLALLALTVVRRSRAAVS